MKTELEQLEENKVLLKVEVPAEDVQKAIDKAFHELASHINIPGFRRGKAPRRVVQMRIGMEPIYEEVMEHDLPAFYAEAIEREGIEPIAPPEVDVVEPVEEGKALVFTATIEVLPKLEAVDYKGIEVTKPEYDVTDEELGRALDNLRDRFAKLEDAGGKKLAKGDFALIDYNGEVNGAPIEGASISDFMYEVGSESLFPEFDTELDGKRKGDILDIKVQMPKEYPDESMAGQTASFKTVVKEVKTKQLPDANDDFAKEASEFDTLDELKDDMRTKMAEMKKRQVDQSVQQEAMRKLIEKTDIEVPDRMIEEYVQERQSRLEQILGSYGMGMDDYMKTASTTAEEMAGDFADDARASIKARLILETIARTEGVEVTEEEIEKELAERAESMQTDAATYRAFLEQQGAMERLTEELARENALKLVVESAVFI